MIDRSSIQMIRDLFGWFIIISFIATLFILYNHFDLENSIARPKMPAIPIEDIDGLHPTVQEKGNELIQRAEKLGISVVITDDYRSADEQDRLYAQGRETAGAIVTNARGGQSMHNYGLAIDYAIKNKSGDVIWDIHYDGNGNGHSDWFEVAEIGKELGFRWGGDWSSFKDYPHLEMTFNYTLNDLQKGNHLLEQ